VLLIFPTDKLPGLADLDQYTDLAKRCSEGKERFQVGVCYLVPIGGTEVDRGGEVDLLEAMFFQAELGQILDGTVKYDDILKLVFHDVLTARYSKRPARKPTQKEAPSPGAQSSS